MPLPVIVNRWRGVIGRKTVLVALSRDPWLRSAPSVMNTGVSEVIRTGLENCQITQVRLSIILAMSGALLCRVLNSCLFLCHHDMDPMGPALGLCPA